MGCDVSVPPPVVPNKVQQIPAASQRKPTSPDSSLPSQPAQPPRLRENRQQEKSPPIQKLREPQSVKPKQPVLVWPLPAQEAEPEFKLTLGKDLEPNSLFRGHDTKVS